MADSVHTEYLRVRTAECTPSGHARPDALCNYLQEAAAHHATVLGVGGEALSQRHMAWVLARLVVDVARLPVWREPVEVHTWPSGVHGIFATRDFEVRAADGDLVARAASSWFLIDASRRRPLRPPEWVTSIPIPDRERAAIDAFDRLPVPDSWEGSAVRHAGRSDEDPNGHVNHVRYLAWALDTVPDRLRQSKRLARVEAHFRGEAHAGDQLSLRYAEEEQGRLIHAVRTDSDRPVADVRTVWEPLRT